MEQGHEKVNFAQGYLWVLGGQRSRSHKDEDRFGGLLVLEASCLTHLKKILQTSLTHGHLRKDLRKFLFSKNLRKI